MSRSNRGSGGYLGDKGADPHTAWNDSILPLLGRCRPLARHPQLFVHLLTTARILPCLHMRNQSSRHHSLTHAFTTCGVLPLRAHNPCTQFLVPSPLLPFLYSSGKYTCFITRLHTLHRCCIDTASSAITALMQTHRPGFTTSKLQAAHVFMLKLADTVKPAATALQSYKQMMNKL